MAPRFVVVVLCGLLASCAGARASQESEPPRPSSSSREIVLAPSQTGRVQGTSLTITFAALVEDSRCPEGVACVWAGDVSARLRLESTEAQAEEVTLHLGPSRREALHGDHRVTLVAVTPHPKAGETTEPASYRVTLRVEKR